MALLSLPPEMLRHIINYTRPDSFESTMLTCKGLHQAGRDYLVEHNTYKKRFCSVHIRANDYEQLARDLADYALGVARYPELGWFVRSLDVEDGSFSLAEQRRNLVPFQSKGLAWLRNEAQGVSRADMARTLHELVVDNAWLKAAGVNHTVWLESTPRFRSILEPDADTTANETDDAVMAACLVALALLLTKLPELRTISLGKKLDLDAGSSLDVDPDTRAVMDLMSARIGNEGFINDDDENVLPPSDKKKICKSRGLISPLENLREFSCGTPPDYETRVSMQDLDPWLTSPKLTAFSATNLVAVDDGYTGIPYTWPGNLVVRYESASMLSVRGWSGIERLELASCCVDADGLRSLLSYMPFLTVLRYTHDTKWHGCECDWDAGGFLQAIKDSKVTRPRPGRLIDGMKEDTSSTGQISLAEQITDLSIGIHVIHGDIITGVTSLREFTSVRTLTVDAQIFLGPNPDSGEREGICPNPPTEPGFEPWDIDSDLPRLVDILSDSVEELELVFTASEKRSLPQLLRGFRDGREKEGKLPNLKKFSLRKFTSAERPGDEESEVIGREGDPKTRKVAAEARAEYLIGRTGSGLSWCDEFGRRQGYVEWLNGVENRSHNS
ncbi:hypothetical protein MN608_10869 [Microdochium nivale]|nr:hypothetical protein MN608_10869 [Microdochium nivale]